MSKTKEYKKILCKYLAQFTFNKIINENDYKIINEFLSDDTIILSKKELTKFIKCKAFIDPSYQVYKNSGNVVPYILESFLDLKIRTMFNGDKSDANIDGIMEKYIVNNYLTELENLGETDPNEWH